MSVIGKDIWVYRRRSAMYNRGWNERTVEAECHCRSQPKP